MVHDINIVIVRGKNVAWNPAYKTGILPFDPHTATWWNKQMVQFNTTLYEAKLYLKYNKKLGY